MVIALSNKIIMMPTSVSHETFVNIFSVMCLILIFLKLNTIYAFQKRCLKIVPNWLQNITSQLLHTHTHIYIYIYIYIYKIFRIV